MKEKLAGMMGGLCMLALLAVGPVRAAELTPVNVNTASVVELTAVKGIGHAKAQAIVDYRKEHGSFATVEDLKQVRGIGDRVLERLRPQISAGSATAAEVPSRGETRAVR